MLGRWAQKPPVGTPIDATADLAAGLVAAVPFYEGCGLPANIVVPATAASNSAAWVATPRYGWALGFTASPATSASFSALPENYAGPFSVVVLAQPSAAIGAYASLASATTTWNLGLNTTATLNLGYFLKSTNTWVGTAANVVDGKWHCWGVSHATTAAGGVSFYRDGIPIGTATQASFPAIGTNGWLTGVGGGGLIGPVALVLVYALALAPAAQATLAANPWAIFTPPALNLAARDAGILLADAATAGYQGTSALLAERRAARGRAPAGVVRLQARTVAPLTAAGRAGPRLRVGPGIPGAGPGAAVAG